jgi:hypothetical protein
MFLNWYNLATVEVLKENNKPLCYPVSKELAY